MKRTALTKKINDAARDAGIEWVFVRHGAQHDLWRCGSTTVTIPRHAEVNEITALSILKRVGEALGEGGGNDGALCCARQTLG